LSPVRAIAPTKRVRDGPSIFIRRGNFSSRIPFRLNAPIRWRAGDKLEGDPMNGLIYLIGLIVVIMAILSFFGLR
jgi:hypothetical protein